ncbi:MAG TPA: ABC transporter transmembrane domain-containing protein, partial [bacterium]|nr:ABC transporter transmembrane domain-containing protein [bacterium]
MFSKALHRIHLGIWDSPEAFSVISRLTKLIAQHRLTLGVGLLCMLGYNVFTAAPAWYMKDVVDALSTGDTPSIERFMLVGGAVVFIFALRGLFYYLQQYLMGSVAERLVARLRTQLFAHVQRLSLAFYSSRPSGELLGRFTSDLLALQEALRVGITGPLRDLPQILFLLGLLLYRSWQLFLASVIVIPIAMVLISRFGRRNQRLTAQRLASFGEMASLLMETVNGIRVVKAFGMEPYEQQRF